MDQTEGVLRCWKDPEMPMETPENAMCFSSSWSQVQLFCWGAEAHQTCKLRGVWRECWSWSHLKKEVTSLSITEASATAPPLQFWLTSQQDIYERRCVEMFWDVVFEIDSEKCIEMLKTAGMSGMWLQGMWFFAMLLGGAYSTKEIRI